MSDRTLNRQTHLVLDFDGTLTAKDTMNVLGKLSKTPSNTWDQIVHAYTKDYNVYKHNSFPWTNFDRQEYSKWLASRKWVEAQSAQRVQDLGFFRYVTRKDIDKTVTNTLQSGELEMRNGWADLLNLFANDSHRAEKRSRVSVVSVNWSKTFIRAVLQQAARSIGDERLYHFVTNIEINANEIAGLDNLHGSTGRVCQSVEADIRTADDKLKFLPSKADTSQGNRVDPLVVYVGDSPTDFDCLCAVDLGIWLYDVPNGEYERDFTHMFRPLKFLPPPLESLGGSAERKPLFYWAPNFATIIKAISSRVSTQT